MPQARRIGVPTNSRQGDAPGVTNYTGVCSYSASTNVSTVAIHASYPDALLHSYYTTWKSIETASNTFTWPAALDTSISDAHTNSYRIILRVSGGVDSPISSAGSDSSPGWMAATVPYLHTLRNETNPRSAFDTEVLVPIPWDATHLSYYTRFLNKLSNRLDGPCPADASHSRKAHVYFIPGFLPCESGTEMSIGYGQYATVWNPTTAAPVLATSWTAASPASGGGTFTLTGDVSAFPQPTAGNYVLMKVGGAASDTAVSAPYPTGSELVLVSNFNRTTKVGTIATNGRGWSGSTAVNHTGNTSSVFFATNANTSGNTTTPITVNGLTGIFDHQQWNRAQWLTAPSKDGNPVTEANRRLWMGDAWISTMVAHLTAMPDIKVGLAGSSVFRDNYVQANRVLDYLKATYDYGDKIACSTTHLGVDAAGIPGSRTYKQFDPNGSAWMLSAASYGHFCGFQTEGLSGLANGQPVIDACEDAISSYPTRWLETNFGSRFGSTQYNTIVSGGWPGGLVRMQEYFLTNASNVEDRIPPV